MKSKVEKPYVLRVAEFIYAKIVDIKNQNPEVNNIQAFEIFMTTKDYIGISLHVSFNSILTWILILFMSNSL